jgi:serine protease AprX
MSHRTSGSQPRGSALFRPAGWALAALLFLWAHSGLGGVAPPSEVLAKLSPTLFQAVATAPRDTVSAWIEFADKGEQGPADLARRLAEADAALGSRARARRIRARVSPLVDYRDLPVHRAYLEDLEARGFRPYGASRWLNAVAVRAPAGTLIGLAALPHVGRMSLVPTARRSADPEATPRPLASPKRAGSRNAVDYGLTLAQLAQINLPAVHDSGYTGAGILICVLDEGFNNFDRHEALRDHVIPPERQRDFFRGIQSVQDTLDQGLSHGTWVLGVLAGRRFGTYVGSAFDAEYALARTEVRSFERPQEMVYWGNGAEWADSLGADLISSSVGYTLFDSSASNYTYADMDGRTTIVSRAAQIAVSKGMLVVNAVGNDGQTSWHYLIAPSDVNGDSLIAVGAVDAAGASSPFSSYGPSADGRVKPDLAALGVSNPICVTYAPDQYGTLSGTSFATPLISGLAACLMQARPQWTPQDVIRALRASASRADSPDDRIGYGIPDGIAALGYRPATPSPPSRLELRSAGANPVVFSRGPALLSLTVPPDLCGRHGVWRVLDLQGRAVRELWTGVVSCGLASPMTVSWDGSDDRGRGSPPGIYVVDFRMGGERVSLRLACLR